jgi:hypothetical protein
MGGAADPEASGSALDPPLRGKPTGRNIARATCAVGRQAVKADSRPISESLTIRQEAMRARPPSAPHPCGERFCLLLGLRERSIKRKGTRTKSEILLDS